jgi:hypothetical protein
MSPLQLKSDFNLQAAEKLIKEHLHAPSVHCSYYSCVQLMLHVIYYKLKADQIEFALEARKQKKGTHGHAIFCLVSELAHKVKSDPQAREDYKKFQKDIIELKSLREKADYQDIVIDDKDSGPAKSLATSTRNILNRRF